MLTLADPETWHPIDGFPDYSVSSHGRVRRDTGARYAREALTLSPLRSGHLSVRLRDGEGFKTQLVHRLVGVAFLPEPLPDKDCVLHRDDIPAHNWPANLYWGDHADNANDKVARGRQAKGRQLPQAKLHPESVAAIRARCNLGEPQRKLAADFGVSQACISRLCRNQTWRHVP